MSAPSYAAALALGSNLPSPAGDPYATLCSAVRQLAGGVEVTAVSPVYETEPVGGPDGQPPYLNAVVLVRTGLSPRALLELGQQIEAAHGRVRCERWGARTLDIDLLDHSGGPIDEADLVVPHPRARERAFVLAPWADVDPTAELGGRGTVADLLAGLDATDVRRRDDLPLPAPGALR